MNKKQHSIFLLCVFSFTSLLFSNSCFAQLQSSNNLQNQNFWDKVQFGGSIGLNIGSGYTDISVSPIAIYNINEYVAVGPSLQFGYVNTDYYNSFLYGGSIIGLVNPIPQLQLSAELEETRFDTKYKNVVENNSINFWNTALYLGAGYHSRNVTVGIRYDVLYDKNKSIYAEPYMPFVRIYF